MIDITKPLELSDGTPVTFVEVTGSGNIAIVRGEGGLKEYYDQYNGRRYGNTSHPICLRNAQEKTPMLDLTKPIQTRDGRAARIIASNIKVRPGEFGGITAVITNKDGYESVSSYTPDGSYWMNRLEDPNDLVNVPEIETQVRYIQFSSPGDLVIHRYKSGENSVPVEYTFTDRVLTGVKLA